MNYDNEAVIIMKSDSRNESFARICAAGFAATLDPTLSEINDIKTAVSEAVTNAIIHGYDGVDGQIIMSLRSAGDELYIEVKDEGKGIKNIEEAMTPMYTSKPDLERSGMGFTVMEMFMDHIEVFSEEGSGTKIVMTKKIQKQHNDGAND